MMPELLLGVLLYGAFVTVTTAGVALWWGDV